MLGYSNNLSIFSSSMHKGLFLVYIKSAFDSLAFQRNDFQVAGARKERAEGHAPILKYFGLKVTSLLFIVQNKPHIPVLTSRESGSYRGAYTYEY